jgi:hypothetical protein
MNDNEPMVELIGNPAELDELAWWSSFSHFNIFNVIRQGEKCYLTSPRFAQIKQDRTIQDKAKSVAIKDEAKKLLPIVRATAKIRGLNVQSLAIGSEIIQDRQKPTDIVVGAEKTGLFIFGELLFHRGRYWKENDTLFFRGHETGRIVNENDQIMREFMHNFPANMPEARSIPELEVLTQEARQLDINLNPLEKCLFSDPYLYETFSYVAEEPGWLSLWKAYEMIKYCVDRNLGHEFSSEKCEFVKNGWATKLELESFTSTANYYLAQGYPRHSRAYYLNKERETEEKLNPYQKEKHRKRKAKYQADNPPMSLPLATKIIRRIFRYWCMWRAANTCLESYQHVKITD